MMLPQLPQLLFLLLLCKLSFDLSDLLGHSSSGEWSQLGLVVIPLLHLCSLVGPQLLLCLKHMGITVQVHIAVA